ncbi:MAG: response regulator transcription factor [Tessaracoccus sp.]|uniref:LuxR C-terminal-related transcriptional regulator n=1 Tax=Tessaracoccus sp. TaxID=1971211 RepID=UPI001EC52F69|nr:response regulator transcription factor [Tessaracoccus sp.]MBK7822239.1 response regulator transcription factor [Tessaracoccus sp.]
MRAVVGIVDDHPAVVLGVATLLGAQPGLLVAATGATVAELLSRRTAFDVVLLDLSLGDQSTPTENLRALVPTGARVLVYTTGDRPQLVREASRAGAIGMIRKSAPAAVMVDAVRAAVRGEVVASAEWAAALDLDTAFVRTVLSDREAEVLALYASGETAERVGEQLYISRETVLDHVRRIRAKYAAMDRPARTKVDLYRRAVEDGILATDD